MSRVKEPPIGSEEIPDYKSPPSRIIRSLRKAYDNAREKIEKKSQVIMGLRGKLRDLEKSRDSWKERTKETENQLELLKKENEELRENKKKL